MKRSGWAQTDLGTESDANETEWSFLAINTSNPYNTRPSKCPASTGTAVADLLLDLNRLIHERKRITSVALRLL